uniref:Protein Shroom n=1 Tax=Timema cristinae TaxID=61476 RepID=A0A7R9CUD6_TIMCR|nr:unnamed protein product [Timema cristinae]
MPQRSGDKSRLRFGNFDENMYSYDGLIPRQLGDYQASDEAYACQKLYQRRGALCVLPLLPEKISPGWPIEKDRITASSSRKPGNGRLLVLNDTNFVNEPVVTVWTMEAVSQRMVEKLRPTSGGGRSSACPDGCARMARDAVYQGRPMMSARSPPPAHQQHAPSSIYSYLHSQQSGLHFAPVASARPHDDVGSGSSSPPVRDAASLKGVKYGPGHEKFPSWPGSSDSAPGGGSTRSKSWTDHTNYPKEKAQDLISHLKALPTCDVVLKTVMERCEKIPPETFESRPGEDGKERLYLPRLDREGKALGDTDYMSPSPPERDITAQLTKADLEEYARSYQDPPLTQVDLEEYMIKPKQAHLTRAELEEYSRSYDESLRPSHQQQPSYAQSEGYHSYVSSTDSTTTTPFLDRLRRDSEATVRPVPGPQTPWDDTSERDHPGRDSVVTTSSGSASSSETLKWHGSLSDVSVASSSCPPNNNSSRQLIAHSSRVQTPQRHHSESVLYLCGGDGWVQRNNNHNKLRLFPVNTYTVQPPQEQLPQSRPAPLSPQQPALSVAERISELERQQQMQTRYTYLDPEKRHRVSDPTLKAIQKKALLSFYERHHAGGSGRSLAWRSEPQLAQPTLAPCPQSPPPQPPPRPRPIQSSRRASSASDYAGGAWRENKPSSKMFPGINTGAAARYITNKNNSFSLSDQKSFWGALSNDSPAPETEIKGSSCGSLSTDLLGPLIVGPSISLDDWVPERPPKKAHLRAAFPPPIPDRLPSPDLPPPSPPPILEDEVFHSDEPLPPPPSDLTSTEWPSSNLAKPSRPSETMRQPMNQAGVPSQQNVDNSFYAHNSSNSVRPQDNINFVPRAAENGSVPLRHSSPYTKPQQSFEKTFQTQTSPESEKSVDKSSLEPAITDSTSNLSKRYSPSNSENRMTHHFENASQTHSSKDNINSLQRNENNVSLQRHSDGMNSSEKNINTTSQKNTENTMHHYWNRNSVSSPQTSPTTDSLGSRFPDTSNDKHSEHGTQRQENTSATLPHKPQENHTLSSKNLENKFSSVFRQQENTFVKPISNVRHSNTNTATARHQWSSNFIQRSLDSVTSSQKYLENGTNSHLLENSFASQRYINNGAPSQRHYNGGPIQKNNDSTNSNHRYAENGLAIHRNNYTSSTAHIHQESGFNFKQGNNGATSPKNNENTINKLSPNKIDSKTGDVANHRPAENGFSVHRYSDGPSLLQKYTSSNVPLQRHFDSGSNVQAQNTNTSSSQRYSQVNPSFVRSTSMKQVDQDDLSSSSLSRFSDQNRSSLRYPTQKLMVNGKLATSLSEWAPSKNGSLKSGDGIRSSMRSVSVMEPSRARLQKVPVMLQSGQSQPSLTAAPRSPPHLSKGEQQAVSRPTHLNQDRGEGNGMSVQISRPSTHTQQLPTERPLLLVMIVLTSVDRGHNVVSTKTPPAGNLSFKNQSRYFFSSSFVLMRPSLTLFQTHSGVSPVGYTNKSLATSAIAELKRAAETGERRNIKTNDNRGNVVFVKQVKEGFGNQVNLCRDRGLNPGPQHRSPTPYT